MNTILEVLKYRVNQLIHKVVVKLDWMLLLLKSRTYTLSVKYRDKLVAEDYKWIKTAERTRMEAMGSYEEE